MKATSSSQTANLSRQPISRKGGREILNFFNWAYANGEKMAESLDYVSMPDGVVKSITTAWSANITDAGGKVIWK